MTPAIADPTASAGWVRCVFVGEQSEWDRHVDALGGHLLQSWRWGAFKGSHNWEPQRILVEMDGNPVLAAQVLLQRAGPFTVAYVPRGPAGWETAPTNAVAAFSVQMDELQRRFGLISFIEPDVARGQDGLVPDRIGWITSDMEFQPLRTLKLHVNRSDDDLLAAMKSKTRYNVRLAERRGVTVRTAGSDEVQVFFRLLEETSQRDRFGIHRVEYYKDLLRTFGDQAALLVAEFEGEPVAAIIVVRHRNEAIYLFGASSSEHQRHMPTHLLQFEAMRWARDNGCTTYDMWGIPPTDEPPESVDGPNSTLNVRSGLWGVYRFKQGFGGDVVAYPGVLERAHYPRLVNLWRRIKRSSGNPRDGN